MFPMLFEVYQNKVGKMQTSHEECIPPADVLLDMKAAGCTFKLDGKAYTPVATKKKTAKKK